MATARNDQRVGDFRIPWHVHPERHPGSVPRPVLHTAFAGGIQVRTEATASRPNAGLRKGYRPFAAKVTSAMDPRVSASGPPAGTGANLRPACARAEGARRTDP